jgi:hypothetical protein
MEEGEWNEDYTEFRMTKLNLHCGDVSAVNYGANPSTSIAARARNFLTEMDRLPSGAALAALRHLEARFDKGGEDGGKAADDGGNGGNKATGRSLNLVRSALLVDED